MHHALLIEHFQHPRNAGELADADAVAEVANPVCGDILKLWLKVENGRVTAIRFKCRGCVAAMACGSALTELAAGVAVADGTAISAGDVERAVGALETASKHAAALAVDAWHAVLANLR